MTLSERDLTALRFAVSVVRGIEQDLEEWYAKRDEIPKPDPGPLAIRLADDPE